MLDSATALAQEARRAGVIAALRQFPTLTIGQLICLARHGKYAGELGEIEIEELVTGTPSQAGLAETIEDKFMRIFAAREGEWLSSSLFIRRLGLPRWTVQKSLAELVAQRLVERRGVTAATRYRLACSSARALGSAGAEDSM